MPKYLKNKRRRRRNIFGISNKHMTQNITMTSDKNDSTKKQKPKKEKQTAFKILSGKKKTNKIKKIIFVTLSSILCITVLVLTLSTPTGIIESFTNFSAVFSFKSHLPVTLNTSETINIASHGNRIFVLTDNDISCYSKNGKLSFNDAHGFSSPVICKSDARCLVYDQNGYGVKIYNAKRQILSQTCTFNILSADITRSGYYAIATKAEAHTSMVTVYNDKGKNIFEWYCPKETICNVAVSPNGKNVAITTVYVSDGKFNSKLYVIGFDSADPIFTKEYNGEFIYGINSENNKTFAVIGENFCDIISWRKFKVTEFKTDYCVDMVKTTSKYTVIASSRENNDGNTTFTFYNNRGKNITSYTFNGLVNDFAIKGKTVFILSNNSIFSVNEDGKLLKEGNCGFGAVKVCTHTFNKCISVGNNDISVVKLHKSGD